MHTQQNLVNKLVSGGLHVQWDPSKLDILKTRTNVRFKGDFGL